MSRRLMTPTLQVSGFLDEFEKDRIKAGIDLVSLFESFGVKLEKKGKSFMGLCPFHEDKNPSLSVDKEKGLFNCFGCGASGDAFDLVMKMKGIGFREALAFLKGEEVKLPEAPASKASDSKEGRKKERNKDLEEKSEVPSEIKSDNKLENEPKSESISTVSLSSIALYYEKSLKPGSKGANYLESRGLLKWGLLKRLKVGFASGELKEKLSQGQRGSLKDLGIFTEKGREAFSGCLVFPLIDETEEVASFYGRKTGTSSLNHLYLKGPHRGLFNRKAFSVYPERMILTESVIDALSLLVLGIENVSALYGTGGLTEDHLKALKDCRTKEVVLALDNDEAGKKAAEKIKEKLIEEGLSIRCTFPEEGKDWNEVLRTTPLSKEDLKSSILSQIKAAELFSLDKINGREFRGKEEESGRFLFEIPPIDYRVLGVKDGFVSSLRVNLRAEMKDQKHIDNVDLFSARSRTSYALSLSRQFDQELARVENDLLSILEWLEADRDRKLSGKTGEVITLTAEERRMGLELLNDPRLFERIEEDLSSLGYVGEGSNKQLMYLAASSRKLLDPISIIVISQSAAGKSYLIDTVKKLMPPEEVVSLTSLSDQALSYLPEESLLHKFLVMGEAVHSDVVDHQMREMLSGKQLSRLVTIKDEKSGKMVSRMVERKVIVSAVMSSATGDINPENASRCFVIFTDESEEQTRAIHREQRRKYSLNRLKEKSSQIPDIVKQHQAAQRLLQNPLIINPFADSLDFPASLMRSRRDHERFIDLITAVCFLRQFQKEEQESGGLRYIACDLEDYRIAYHIMMSVLPSTMSSFPKSAQLLYESIRKILQDKTETEGLGIHEVSITQREIREKQGLEHNFVKRNIRVLVDYDYLLQKGGQGRGSRSFYRLSQDAPLCLFDLSLIPSPEEIEKRVKVGHFSESK